MEVLKVENLSKYFGGLRVLQGINFTAETGEKLAIIGPNGAGKSTLFGVIGGQLPATDGQVYLSGNDITSMPPHRRLHLGLARSFQLNNLFFHLTLQDNMLLALKGGQLPHFRMLRPMDAYTDLMTTAQELLESMGLWEMRFAPVSTLSYGDQRRLEIAFALASNPKILMLDEPSAGLTSGEAMEFANTIRKLVKDTVLLFCAHDMDLVFNLADRIMVLYFGQIIAQGKPQEIRANPRVREIYLGTEEADGDAGSK